MSIAPPRPTRRPTAARAARILLLAAFVLLGPALSGLARAQEADKRQFDKWTYFSATDKSGARYFVSTAVDAKANNVELLVYKSQNACGQTLMLIRMYFSQPTTQAEAVNRKDVSGEIRVDDAPVHKILCDITLRAGERIGTIRVKSFENPAAILPEMQNGQTVRFRFELGKQDAFQRFPLQGFRQAFEVVQKACAQADATGQAKRQSPAQSPKAKPQPKSSDADFFGPQGSSSPSPSGGKKTDKDYF